MATTTTQPVQIETAAALNPLARWHLLSLDAPTVATLWTWFIARANGIHLPSVTIAAMFCAVWVLYAADRLLDARTLSKERAAFTQARLRNLPALEARHLFHHRHRTRFVAIIALTLVLMLVLIPQLNPIALRLFAAEGLLLAGWFFTLHATPLAHHLPKELALGVFFAAAVCIPTVARLQTSPIILLPGALVFAFLCSLNCLFIYRWESTRSAPSAHPSTRFAARHACALAVATALSAAALALALHSTAAAVPAACAFAAAALLLLDRARTRFHRTTLRAAADLALLTPLLLLPFLR